MKKTRKFIFLLTLFFICLTQIELYAFSIRNEKGKTKAGSSGGLHKPSYNPGGEEFEQDREFFEVYQKKYNQSSNNSEYINSNCDFYGIPGAKLIEETSVERLGHKELQEISSKKYFCVSNSELPEELMFLVESECEQEFYNKPTNDYVLSSSKQKKEMIKQISSSEVKKNKNLYEFNYQNQEEECEDEFQIEKTNFSKNNQNCEKENLSDENEPLIKFRE